MSQATSRKLLITSAGNKVPLLRLASATVGAIPNLELLVGDSDLNTLAPSLGFSFWQMPPSEEPNLTNILHGVLARGVKLIIPTRDSELSFWARNRSVFEEHDVRVAVSTMQGVQTCLDKLEFSMWGENAGLPVIPSSLRTDFDAWNTMVIKERFGSGSKGFAVVYSEEQALSLSRSWQSPIFQPLVNGTEISIDSWFSENSDLLGFVMRTRDLVVGGESQITTTFRNEELEEQIEHAMRLIGRGLTIRGPLVMQAFMSSDGIRIIEANARLGGASTVSARVGLNVVRLSVLEHLDSGLGPPRFSRKQYEVKQIRHKFDEYTQFSSGPQ